MAIAPMSATKVDEWNGMTDINIKGVLYGIAAALPIFQKQESGHLSKHLLTSQQQQLTMQIRTGL